MTIRQATTEVGAFFYLAEDFFIAAELDRGLAWELSVLQTALAHLPAEGPCHIIDVGAHIGLYTIPCARRVQGRGRVHAFEPHAFMADLLCRNVEANNCSAGVEVFRCAAGHVDGVDVSLDDAMRDGPNIGVPYRYEDARAFNYAGVQLGLGARKVVMRTLDSFAFANVALLKVDAEGTEPLVLWGARPHRALPSAHPVRARRQARHRVDAVDDRHPAGGRGYSHRGVHIAPRLRRAAAAGRQGVPAAAAPLSRRRPIFRCGRSLPTRRPTQQVWAVAIHMVPLQ